jgi:protein-tyrosine phosphatase
MQCKNLRDVSQHVTTFPVNKIYRGGAIEYVSFSDLRSPATIVNLRQQLDDETQFEKLKNKPVIHNIGKERDLDAYNVHDKNVQKWILNVLKLFETSEVKYPLLVHCASGKDRTGIIVTCLLLICEQDRTVVETEFVQSIGIEEEHIQLHKAAVDHILTKGLKAYFRGINLDKVRKNVIG